MSETSKMYKLPEGMTCATLGTALVGYLRSHESMVAEGAPDGNGGFFVQAKTEDDGWKSIAGMSKAIQVQIAQQGDTALVSVGHGKWSDKVGAGVVGAFIFAPLAVTAGIGAYNQNKLVDTIFGFIEQYIMSGGRTAEVTLMAPPTAPAQTQSAAVVCPKCHMQNAEGSRFCSSCGEPLSITCPSCGASLPLGTKFCPSCGSPLVKKRTCPTCGAELADGAKFCAQCGTPAA